MKAVGDVDVVLDDGGHTYAQQVITTEMLLGSIKDGGMLVVEDTHTSYMDGFGSKCHSFMRYVKKFADRINHRFGHLDRTRAASREWSVQVFESIVAFHVNRKATGLLSEPTTNNGKDDAAKDYRHAGNLIGSMEKLAGLRAVPGVRFVARKLRHGLASLADLASPHRKYF